MRIILQVHETMPCYDVSKDTFTVKGQETNYGRAMSAIMAGYLECWEAETHWSAEPQGIVTTLISNIMHW